MGKEDRKLSASTRLWLLFVLILIISMRFAINQLPGSIPDEVSSSDQSTAAVRSGDIRVSAFGSGTLISAADAELAFEVGGVIDEILVETGDEIKEGQVLARLDGEDLKDVLLDAEQNLRELTSDVAIAAAALELAEAKKAVLTAEYTLSFYLSPYVYKSEIRLREAEGVLQEAVQSAALNPSDEADERIVTAQAAVEKAQVSLALNWETYYEEYVPDFFNFRWER